MKNKWSKWRQRRSKSWGSICSWDGSGGFAALLEEEAWGLLCEVCSFFLSSFFSYLLIEIFPCLLSSHFKIFLLVINLLHSFQGLDLLKRVSAYREVAQQLEAEGLKEKLVCSKWVRGRGFVWASEGSCVPHLQFPCPAPM